MSDLSNVTTSGARPDRTAFPRVHGYDLLAVLGEGAAGVVYEARKLGDPQALAIKILHAYLATDDQVRGRFMREAEILASLDGPTVCPVLAIGETDDTALPYMVMPKLQGLKLSDIDKTRLDAQQAVELVGEICAALETAHRAGVIHRDLKPDNVIVGDGRVTVVDFGMAKIVRGAQEGPQNAELTTNGMIFGTPEYMAPEQARGEAADPRCDVYAAGVILYELLCGEVPFSGANAILTLVKVSREEAVPLRQRTTRSDLSEALEACVMHAIAKDRNERYPSARVFRDALAVAMSHPERVAVVRPDHYFDTEGEAGLTLPLSGRLKASAARGVAAANALDDDQEATLDVRTFNRKREIETMPDLRSEAPPASGPVPVPVPVPISTTPGPSRVMVNRRPLQPASSAPPPSPPTSHSRLPAAPSSAPSWGSAPPSGHTPAYASRVPPALAARAQPAFKRTALLLWGVLACVAILVGIYLALGTSTP